MKLTEFVLCEDVRQEMGGKASLMGVMSSGITLQSAPSSNEPLAIRIAAFIGVELDEGETAADFEITIQRDNGEVILKRADVIPQNTRAKRLQVMMGAETVLFRESGELLFSFAIRESAGSELLRSERTLSVEILEPKKAR